MTGLAKWLFCIFLLSTVLGAQAQTINAASCSSTDVQGALNSVSADGTTVNVPGGNCTWTSGVTYNQVFSTTIAGQTTCAGTPASTCTDNTTIGLGTHAFSIHTATNKSFRLTGLSFTTSGQKTLFVGGGSQAVRIDHIHVTQSGNYITAQVADWVYGVMDHAVWDLPPASTANGIEITHGNWNNDTLGLGDGSWADSSYFGSNRFFFVEDSTFNNGAANDCTEGGRYVFRHNQFNATAPAPVMQTHPTGGAGRFRGCRALEIYDNTLHAVSANYINTAIWISSGTGLIWGNSTDSSTAGGGTGFRSLIHLVEMRDPSVGTYTQQAPPAGWGYCNGASNWDQNSDATGYACLDQPGRGKGDMLTGGFTSDGSGSNNVTNLSTGCTSASACAYPRQALEPIYEWLNAYSPVPNNPSGILGTDGGHLNNNRDYYLGDTNAGVPISFNGTSGVGRGLLSARPSSCTTGVAYWATDASTLYQCISTNTWAVYYIPYTYPHPLTGSGGGGIPGPPSGLSAVVN